MTVSEVLLCWRCTECVCNNELCKVSWKVLFNLVTETGDNVPSQFFQLEFSLLCSVCKRQLISRRMSLGELFKLNPSKTSFIFSSIIYYMCWIIFLPVNTLYIFCLFNWYVSLAINWDPSGGSVNLVGYYQDL